MFGLSRNQRLRRVVPAEAALLRTDEYAVSAAGELVPGEREYLEGLLTVAPAETEPLELGLRWLLRHYSVAIGAVIVSVAQAAGLLLDNLVYQGLPRVTYVVVGGLVIAAILLLVTWILSNKTKL